MNKPLTAFISYKSEEANAAYFVKNFLLRNGISVWMAPDSIPASSSYPEEIYDGISGCDAFVLILSERSQMSKWVFRELHTADNLEKPIFPFVIENCVLMGRINMMISDLQMIDAYNNMDKAAERLTTIATGIISFALIIIAVSLAVWLLRTIIKRARKSSAVLGFTDRLLGFVLGGVIGLLLAWIAIALLMPVTAIVSPDNVPAMFDALQATTISRVIYDVNPLLYVVKLVLRRA